MLQLCIVLLLCLALAGLALAADSHAVRVSCQGALPFDRETLQRAVDLRVPLLRLPKGPRATRAEVLGRDAGEAIIMVGGSSRTVSLRGLSGKDAARIVALLVLDLASNLRESNVPAEPKPPAVAPAPSDRVAVSLSPRLAVGAREWSASFEPTVDLAVKVSRLFLVFAEAGFTWTAAGDGDRKLTLMQIPVRAGAGLRYRWFEARASVALRPYLVSGAGDDSGVVVGGGLGLSLRTRLTRWLVGHASAGVDILSRRKEFRVNGDTVMTTSWAVPWVGVGAGWQGG